MSHSSALDSVESVLAIIKKGNADAAQKLAAILPIVEGLRNTIQDLAEDRYADYVPELPPPNFDMDEVVEALYEQLSKQIYNNLYAHYTAATLSDERDPHVRVAICRALVRIAQEHQRKPSSVWTVLIQQGGIFSEASE